MKSEWNNLFGNCPVFQLTPWTVASHVLEETEWAIDRQITLPITLEEDPEIY